MPATQYKPMIAGDLPEEFNVEEENTHVGVHRTVWQFAKMVVVLGAVIGLIALVSTLPHMGKGKKSETIDTIDTDGLIGEYASDVCSEYQGVGHLYHGEACCAKACGHYCGTANCQLGPPGYKACCASWFHDAEGTKLYCGNGQMAPCWVTTTLAPTTPAPTPAPIEVVKGKVVASTQSGEASLQAAKTGGTDKLACRQALGDALHLDPSAVSVTNVEIRSTGDSWAGGGVFVFEYAITAVKGSAVFKTLQEPTVSMREKVVAELEKAFKDLNINTVVTGVTFPQPSISVAHHTSV